MSKRTIFIGDVHGCFEELCDLLHQIKPSGEDNVIFLGDIIGKGPMVQQTIEYLYRRPYTCLMGNHEWQYLKRSRYPHAKKFVLRYHKWIASFPLYMEGESYIAVHGGLPPVPKDYKEASPISLLNIRYWKNGKINHHAGIPWHHLYKGHKKVIYGHWAQQGFHETKMTLGLDTGCVYGGKLSAYIMETRQLIQVKAFRSYAPIARE